MSAVAARVSMRRGRACLVAYADSGSRSSAQELMQ